MIYKKIYIKDAISMGRNTCILPIDDKAVEIYRKIPLNENLEVNKIKSHRQNKTHKTFIQVCLCAIENGLLEKNIKIPINDTELIISHKVITCKIIENGYDTNPELRTLIDIFEELYCKSEIITNVNGEKIIKKGSIQFMKKDEIEFRLFCEKSYKVITYNLNCFVGDLLKGIKK
jgi:hypothetical protein